MVSCGSGSFGFGDFGGFAGFGPLGDSAATYSFAAPTGTTVGSTLTETITSGSWTETITYTEVTAATATTAAQFEILRSGASVSSVSSSSTGTPTTYAFDESANGTTNVIETITRTGSTETLTYTGGTTLSDDLITITTPSTSNGHNGTLSYDFTISGSTVTETETFTSGSTSSTHTVTPDPTTVFASTTSSGGTPEETVTYAQGDAIVTQTYIQVASGSYALASTNTAYIAQGTATTALDVNSGDRAEIAIGASSTTITPVTALGTTGKSFTASSDATFAIVTPTTTLAGSFVEETATFGSHTSETLFYSATGTSGIYTEVAHGTSIDVSGVATQLASLPSAVLALL